MAITDGAVQGFCGEVSALGTNMVIIFDRLLEKKRTCPKRGELLAGAEAEICCWWETF